MSSVPAGSLKGRHFLRELDFSGAEWGRLLGLARTLKDERREGRERTRLDGRTIALVFEKSSTRTRAAFEVAAYEQGARVTHFDAHGSHFGKKESVADTARVLGRMYAGIQFRGIEQSTVEELAAHAGVPVWNGLTDAWHPTQSLCDVFTMRESLGRPDAAFAYVGDARFNMGNSLLVAGALSGMDVRIVAPEPLQPAPDLVAAAHRLAQDNGGRVLVTDDLDAGVADCDFIHTDVWVSMGETESVWSERIGLLLPYRVTAELLARTGNPDVKFMHCLPAFHDRRTSLGEEVYQRFGLDCMEVSDAVFESPASIVFDQAENRMHTIKAVLVATLAGE